MLKRFSAPHHSSPNVPEARRAGRSFFTRSARPLIGKRSFSKPERMFFSGMAGVTMATSGGLGLPVFALSGDPMMIIASAGCLVFGANHAIGRLLELRSWIVAQIDHATAVQTELHLDNAALRQELAFARHDVDQYRNILEFLAAGQVGGAEGDELCGESPSAGNVVPFRRMH